MEPLAPEDLVEDWSDLSASSLGPGARLGRYELLIPIAYGGMARVWAARLHGQRGFSKLVAIKTILPHLAHNPEFERMFLDEARIAAGVHHPNVTEIYELGEEGRVLYLAMEWVNGDSLVHVLRGISGKQVQPVDVRLAARMVADACAGLHAAHELTDDDGRLLNVVHRDVSPHNILVSQEGTVKVTDFGVAKAYGQTHQATAAGQIKGKVAYMAPEQIGGQAFDRRSDVFAMGCLLYETITGVQPFRGGNDPQVMQAVLRGTYEPPSKLVRSIPPEIESIIDRALAPEPRQRFATAERMRVALEEWLAKSGGVVTATQVGSLVRQRLGAHLDKRREHVRAAMQSMASQDPNAPRSAAGTPSSQSHSGVVIAPAPPVGAVPGTPSAPGQAAMRARMASNPMMAQGMTPPPGTAMTPAGPPALPLPAPLPIQQPDSTSKYVVAAVAGVLFALVVGGIGVVAWMLTSHGEASAPAGTTATAAAMSAPPPAHSTPAGAASAPAASAAQAATAAPSDAPAPSTIDVSDLPMAKPDTAPPAHAGGAAPPAITAKKPAPLPANPY